jgi:hypothetical protein
LAGTKTSSDSFLKACAAFKLPNGSPNEKKPALIGGLHFLVTTRTEDAHYVVLQKTLQIHKTDI